MTTLALGPDPDPLLVSYVLGDPFVSSLTLLQNGTPVAWPAAPVLEFAGGITWTAALSTAEGVANAKATWNESEAAVTALHTASPETCRLAVSGETLWAGRKPAQRA